MGDHLELAVITGSIVGDKEVIARLKAMPDKVFDAVALTVYQLGVQLQRQVVTGYLSGPRPTHLGRVTGRLAASITGGGDTRSRFERNGLVATSYVGTNVSYGAAWENGFSKKVGAGARGGPRFLTSAAEIQTYFAKHPPGVKQVPARPFLTPALQQMKPMIIAEIQKTVLLAAQNAMKS